MTLELRLALACLDEQPTEAALALERLAPEERAALIRELPDHAASVLRRMEGSAAAAVLSRLTAEEASRALQHVPLDEMVHLLRRLPLEEAERLLAALPERSRDAVRPLLRYPEGTAGALTDPDVLALPDDISVAEARVRLRRAAGRALHYLFVVDRAGRLAGVFDLPELLRARAREPLKAVMHTRVEALPAWMPASAVRAHPGWRSFHAMPVVGEQNRFLGAIRYTSLRRLERELSESRGTPPGRVTASALGELFHVGMAAFVEGVVSSALPPREAAPVTAKGNRP